MLSSQSKHCESSTERSDSFSYLLDGARRGESEALSILYQQFLPGVSTYIKVRVPEGMTEDLTAEVFLKMIEGIHRLRASDEAGFISWLLQIARISIADFYRQRRKHPVYIRLEPELWEKEDIREAWRIFSNHLDTDPVQWAEVREEWDSVVRAINMLTEEQRLVVISRLLLGYNVKTVAARIGKNANAVKALPFRALHSIRRQLS